MITDHASVPDNVPSQDCIIASIVASFDRAAVLSSYEAFHDLVVGVTGIRKSAYAPWAGPISRDQRDLLHARITTAHRSIAAMVGPQMQTQVNLMFGGVYFLVNSWSTRPAGPMVVQGSFAQATALATILELYLEFSRLWVFVDQMSQQLTEERRKLFTAMFDVTKLAANGKGEA